MPRQRAQEDCGLCGAVHQRRRAVSGTVSVHLGCSRHGQDGDGARGGTNHAANVLLPRLLQLRDVVDGLEGLVDDDRWPLPSYREMLFVS